MTTSTGVDALPLVATAEQRQAYAEELLPWAERLVDLIHDEGPAAAGAVIAIVRRTQPPAADMDPMATFAVILAAMIDAGQPTSTRLGWITW